MILEKRFKIAGMVVPCKIRRSDSKYAYIKIDTDKKIEVVIPKGQNVDVRALLKKKEPWIRSKYREIITTSRTIEKDRLLLNGEVYALKLDYGSNTSNVQLDDHKLIVSAKGKREAIAALRDWISERSRRMIEDKVKFYAKKMGVKFNKIFLRNSRKWGACSVGKNLSFNWQIACLPEDLAEYVIIHELAHLKVFNHSKEFWKLVSSLCPEYRQRQNGLKCFLSSNEIRIR